MDCCGFEIAYDFRCDECDEYGEYDDNYSDKETILEKLDKGLSRQMGVVHGDLFPQKRAGSFAILNEFQKDFWEPELFKRNFELVKGGINNPNSDAQLFIYLVVHKKWQEDE
jgi:hypothetical protein